MESLHYIDHLLHAQISHLRFTETLDYQLCNNSDTLNRLMSESDYLGCLAINKGFSVNFPDTLFSPRSNHFIQAIVFDKGAELERLIDFFEENGYRLKLDNLMLITQESGEIVSSLNTRLEQAGLPCRAFTYNQGLVHLCDTIPTLIRKETRYKIDPINPRFIYHSPHVTHESFKVPLFRVEATKPFRTITGKRIEAGDKGGYLEHCRSLDITHTDAEEAQSWIDGNAIVTQDFTLSGSSYVGEDAALTHFNGVYAPQVKLVSVKNSESAVSLGDSLVNGGSIIRGNAFIHARDGDISISNSIVDGDTTISSLYPLLHVTHSQLSDRVYIRACGKVERCVFKGGFILDSDKGSKVLRVDEHCTSPAAGDVVTHVQPGPSSPENTEKQAPHSAYTHANRGR